VEQVSRVGEKVWISARTRTDTAVRCPDCHTLSRRIHSRYRRCLTDMAVGGQPVVIELSVRRLFCDRPGCPRRTFAEQVEGLTIRYGRYTPLLLGVLRAVGLALAGRAGARLMAVLATVVSRVTLLSLVMALDDPPVATPRVLGVDDFALRKREVYGTVVIDCESRRPVDVLPDREADTFAAWLTEHPGVQVICRDRGGAYADAARVAAPGALQVADRWHLWHNLGEAVDKEVARHRACLPEPPAPVRAEGEQERAEETATALASAYAASHIQAQQIRERYRAVRVLLEQGKNMQAIARQLHLAYNSVRKYAHAETLDALLGRAWEHHETILDDFKPYLHQRLYEGKHSDAELYREIKQQGYRGGYGTVSGYLRLVRKAGFTPPAALAPPKVREVAGWIMSPPGALSEDNQQRLGAVLARCPELDATLSHVRAFADMLTTLRGDRLRPWLAQVYHDTLPGLHSFANGIDRDRPAVIAGLTLPYSSGAVEGHVNRIKMIKRQMYGRAGFPLLRKRVLLS
jgi:transposase